MESRYQNVSILGGGS